LKKVDLLHLISIKSFLTKQTELLDEYASKNEDGSYVTKNDGIALANPIKYSSSLEILKDEYKEVIDAQDALNKKFETFLKSDIKFKFDPIPKKYIPATIKVSQMHDIFLLIEQPKS